MTLTATKIDSLHQSGKNFIIWAWPASTTIIYNNYSPVETLLKLCSLKLSRKICTRACAFCFRFSLESLSLQLDARYARFLAKNALKYAQICKKSVAARDSLTREGSVTCTVTATEFRYFTVNSKKLV
jgi:hypothetical protein